MEKNGGFVNGKNIWDTGSFSYRLLLEARIDAYNRLDAIFMNEVGKSESVHRMKRFFGYESVGDEYKKKMRDLVMKDFELAYIANETLAKTVAGTQVEIRYGRRFYAKDRLKPGIKLIDGKTTLSWVAEVVQKTGFLFYPWYALLKKVKWFSKPGVIDKYQVAISVDQPDCIFLKRYYGETILLDEKELPAEKVLFIDESRKPNMRKYAKFGLNGVSLMEDRQPVGFGFWKKVLVGFTPLWLMSLPGIFTEKPIIIRTTAKLMTDWIRWSIMAENYKIKNYVRRLVPDGVGKITMLRKMGAKTWHYYPDATSVDNLDGWAENCKVDTDFTFMDYDVCVVYGRRTEQFFKAHGNNIREYIKNGIMYAQITREIEDGKHPTRIDEYLKDGSKKVPKNALMVGVFDTTFAAHAPMHADDGAAFGRDMLRLLEENPEMFMVFKVKYPWEGLPIEIRSVYTKLREHKRCLLFPTADLDSGSASEVIAKTDFVISVAYTSTTIEALGAGKKGIYYDPNGRYRGDGYYYNRIPEFVAHDYGELETLIRYWTQEAGEKEFKEFLNQYIKPEFDPYMDCKAISRFRRMLQA